MQYTFSVMKVTESIYQTWNEFANFIPKTAYLHENFNILIVVF